MRAGGQKLSYWAGRGGDGASQEQWGPMFSRRALDLWNLSIFSRWLGRVQIRRAWGGGGPLYSRGTDPCSDSLSVARVCSVPGVTSPKMPEPGKKPGSSRPGVGAERGAGRAGDICNWGRASERVPEGVDEVEASEPQHRGTVLLGPFFDSQFLLLILLMRVRVNQGQGHRVGESQGRKWAITPLSGRRRPLPCLHAHLLQQG